MRLLANLLAFLLLLFMANLCFSASGRETVVVFKDDKTEVSFKTDDDRTMMVIPPAFRVPAFVGGTFNNKELLVLLCNAHYNTFERVRFIEAAARTSYGNHTSWSDAEIVSKNTLRSAKNSVLGDSTAVMKNKKIYVLAPRWDASYTARLNDRIDTGWNPLMIVGTVINRMESNGYAGVYVKWDKESSLKDVLPKTVHGTDDFQFISGVGNGVVTKNGTIIFPIQIANKSMQYASSIMYSADDGSTWHIGKRIEHGPSECSVTEWGNGKLLLYARYDYGYRLIYESNDMGATWKESTMFSGVWGNNQYRISTGSQGSLITAPVDGENILLFSHPLNTEGEYERDTLQLWMSDGQRIKCVGTISEEGKGERSGYSILAHVGENLYVAHEINPCIHCSNYNALPNEWDGVIAISSIPDLFDSVKSTARAWRKVDAKLKNIKVPTNGLVGFLAGGNKNDNVWEDEYNCVHANVIDATPVDGGFRFDGKEESGAQWPVQSQGQNQVYLFTATQFTIMATVKIHKTQVAGDHLLLGASKDKGGESLMVGLGYTQDKKWYVVDSKGVKIKTKDLFELEKENKMTITYSKRKVSVYVENVAIVKGREIYFSDNYFNHFFMGGIGKPSKTKSCLCTMKNVMLFNRDIMQPEETEIQNVENDGKQKDSTSSTKSQETSDSGRKGIPHEDGKDKTDKSGSTASTNSTENPTSVNKSSDEDSKKKDDKRVDGAVGFISFAAWMCFVYSAIVLVGL